MIPKEIDRNRFDRQMMGILESTQARVTSTGSNIVAINDIVLTFLETNCVGTRILTNVTGEEQVRLMIQRIKEYSTPLPSRGTTKEIIYTKGARQLLNAAETESKKSGFRTVGSDYFLVGLITYFDKSAYPPFKNITLTKESVVDEITRRFQEAKRRSTSNHPPS